MIAVTGCPRSGTSCMMDQLRLAFGDDRILGKKFPQLDYLLAAKERGEGEDENHYKARLYLQERGGLDYRIAEAEESKDMNPNGFWEMRYTVGGIQWHWGMEDTKGKIGKIVSQGLIASNPDYIEKIIYMVRCPRQVAKSQERLRRIMWMTRQQEQELKIHTPEMFIRVTYQASLWLDKYKDWNIPIIYVNFDDMISKPDETLEKVREFLEDGDFSNHTITPKLKRSTPEKVPHRLWEQADAIYDLLKQQKHKEIIDYFEEQKDYIDKENTSVMCFRRGTQSVYNECMNCRNNIATRNGFKKTAENNGVKWWEEPCMFECYSNPDGDLISMEESIENNFWKENICLTTSNSQS
jgi:hypothetical protein